MLQALEVFDDRLLLCDIGGGSTELLIGERSEVLASASLKLGAVRLTNRFFAGDPTAVPPPAACCARPWPDPTVRRGRLAGGRGDGQGRAQSSSSSTGHVLTIRSGGMPAASARAQPSSG